MNQTMDTDPNSPTFRRQAFLMAFLLKKHVRATVNFLKNELPDVTSQEVRIWFERFKTGNLDIVTDIDMIPLNGIASDIVKEEDDRGLNGFPDIVKRRIIEFTGYAEQRSLLAVNRSFRNIIKGDNRLYRKIKLALGMDFLALAITTPFEQLEQFIYTKKENGCELNNRGKIAFFPTSYLHEGMKKFNDTVEKKGTIIERLEITSRKPKTVDPEYVEFYSKCNNAFNELKNKLHVEDLRLEAGTKENFCTVLNSIATEVLQDCTLDSHTDTMILDSKEIPCLCLRLPSLSSLLTTYSVRLNIPLDSYAAIPIVNVKVETLTEEAIRSYKAKLNDHPAFVDHIFGGNFDENEVMRGFEPFETDPFGKYTGIFVTTGGIRIGFHVNGRSLEMTKISKFNSQ